VPCSCFTHDARFALLQRGPEHVAANTEGLQVSGAGVFWMSLHDVVFISTLVASVRRRPIAPASTSDEPLSAPLTIATNRCRSPSFFASSDQSKAVASSDADGAHTNQPNESSSSSSGIASYLKFW
jgi:hypothetical protein